MPLFVVAAVSLEAVVLPTAILTSVGEGSNDTTSPYTDDVLLDSISFGSTTFSAISGQFVAGTSFYVSSGRANVNAERGDNDTNSDGNPDPFARVGLDPSLYESTDPAYQDLALSSAFSSLSLTEGADGEAASYTFVMTFAAGITDNDVGEDSVPEVVLFERGNNDTSTIRAITGGTFDNPTYAENSITIKPGGMWNTGISIDTFEIGGGQELAAVGIDLSEFGSAGTIFGLEITSAGGDFYGQMLSPEDPETQLDYDVPEGLINPASVVPESATYALLSGLFVLGMVVTRRVRR
jgi:hypothetical protein